MLPLGRKEGFITSNDGCEIWYEVEGEGPLTLVLCDGVACTGYIWKYFYPYFRRDYRIVHTQYRGHGRSSTPRDLATLHVDFFASDTLAVLQELGIERSVVFVGHSMGVQVALECAFRQPKLCEALVLINGPFGEALKHVRGVPYFAQALPFVQKFIHKHRDLVSKVWAPLLDNEGLYWYAKLFEVNPWLTKRQDFRVYFRDLAQMDPEVYLASLDGATRHSSEGYLKDIKQPTLIIAGDKDRFTPYSIPKKMRQLMPHAEFMTMPTGSHIGPLELPEYVHLRVEKFLNQCLRGRQLTQTQAKPSPASPNPHPKKKKKK